MPTVPTVSGRQVLSTGVQAPAQQAFVSQHRRCYCTGRESGNICFWSGETAG
jgi:hypothetical protein